MGTGIGDASGIASRSGVSGAAGEEVPVIKQIDVLVRDRLDKITLDEKSLNSRTATTGANIGAGTYISELIDVVNETNKKIVDLNEEVMRLNGEVDKGNATTEELKKALSKCIQRIGELKAQVVALTGENNRLKTEIESLRRQQATAESTSAGEKTQLKAKISELEGKILKNEKEIENHKGQVSALESENNSLKAELEKAKAQIASQSAEIQSFGQSVAELTAQVERLKAQNLELGHANTTSKEETEQVKAQNSELEKQLASLKGNLETIERTHAQMAEDLNGANSFNEANSSKIEGLNNELSCVRASLDAANDELSQARIDLADRDKKLEEANSMLQKVQAQALALQLEVSEKGATIAQNQASIIELQSAIQRKDDLIGLCGQERTSAEQRAAELKAQIASLQTQIGEINRTKDASLGERESEISQLKSQISTYEAELTSKNQEILALRNQIDTRNRQVCSLRSQLNTFKRQETILNHQVRDLSQRNSALANEKATLITQINSIEAKRSELERHIEQEKRKFTDEKGRLESEVRRLRGENCNITAQVRDLKEKVDSQTAIIGAMQEERDALMGKIEDNARQTGEQNRSYLSMAMSLIWANNSLSRLKAEQTMLVNQLRIMDGKIDAATRQRDADSATLMAQQARITSLTHQLSEKENTLNQRDATITRLSGEFAKLTEQFNSLASNLADVERRSADAHAKLSAKDAELARVRDDLSRLNSAYTSSQTELRRVNSQLTSERAAKDRAYAAMQGLQDASSVITQKSANLEATVAQLRENLENTRRQLEAANRGREAAGENLLSLQAERDDIFARLTAQSSQLETLQRENGRLMQQLAQKEQRVQEFTGVISSLVEELQSSIIGDTAQVELGMLEELCKLTANLPSDIIINLYVSSLNCTLNSIEEMRSAADRLRDEILDAPKRRREEFEKDLEDIRDATSRGETCLYTEGNEIKLARFWKAGAFIDFDYEDRSITNGEFFSVADLIIDKLREPLLQNSEFIEFRENFNGYVDIDSIATLHTNLAKEEFRRVCAENPRLSHCECINKLAELTKEAEANAFEDAKNQVAEIILNATQQGAEFDEAQRPGLYELVERYVEICGNNQYEAARRIVFIEAKKVMSEIDGDKLPDGSIMPGFGETMSGAAAKMVEGFSFSNAGNAGEFLFQTKLRLAAAYDEPLKILTHGRFTKMSEDGPFVNLDALEAIRARLILRCTSFLGKTGFTEYLSSRGVGGDFVKGWIGGIYYFEPNPLLIEFFSGDIEALAQSLSSFTLHRLQEIGGENLENFGEAPSTWRIKPPNAEATTWFYKVKHCIEEGDAETFPFALVNFIGQFFYQVYDSLNELQERFSENEGIRNAFEVQKSSCRSRWHELRQNYDDEGALADIDFW
jgi:chromosome segregation ATPase